MPQNKAETLVEVGVQYLNALFVHLHYSQTKQPQNLEKVRLFLTSKQTSRMDIT